MPCGEFRYGEEFREEDDEKCFFQAESLLTKDTVCRAYEHISQLLRFWLSTSL